MNKNLGNSILSVFSKVTVAVVGAVFALIISVSAVSGGEGGLSDSANQKTESQNHRQSDNSLNIFKTYTKVSIGPSRIGYHKMSFKPERVKSSDLPEIKTQDSASGVIRVGGDTKEEKSAGVEKVLVEKKVSGNKAEEPIEEDDELINEGFGDDAISFELDEEKMEAVENMENGTAHPDSEAEKSKIDEVKKTKIEGDAESLQNVFVGIVAFGIVLTMGALGISTHVREK